MIRRLAFALLVVTACTDVSPTGETEEAPSGDAAGTDAGVDAALSGCLIPLEPRTDIASPRRARPLYLQASDEAPPEVDRRSGIYTRMIAALQTWYGSAMGEAYQQATFAAEPVIVLRSRYTVA